MAFVEVRGERPSYFQSQVIDAMYHFLLKLLAFVFYLVVPSSVRTISEDADAPFNAPVAVVIFNTCNNFCLPIHILIAFCASIMST